MITVNCAKQEHAQFTGTAKSQKLFSVRQRTDRILDLPKPAVKPILQLWHRHVRHVTFVKGGERKTELGPELLKTHLDPF